MAGSMWITYPDQYDMCSRCTGNGRIRCSSCLGAGQEQEYGRYNEGRSWRSCSRCAGSGERACESCGGSGSVRRSLPTKHPGGEHSRSREDDSDELFESSPNWTKRSCRMCQGTGRQDCRHCYGTGRYVSSILGGVACPYCASSGRDDCSLCYGKGFRWISKT
jgi:hypothetical protein